MTEPLSRITTGTVGSMPCEIAMNAILTRLDNAHITRKVMSKYNGYKEVLRDLESLRGKKTWKRAMLLFRNHHLSVVDNMEGTIPKDLLTHLKCCMTAQYRRTLEND